LRHQDLNKETLELAVVIRLTDPGAKDERSTHRENHVVKVRRVLDCRVTESPYLARLLLVFDDQQLATGVTGGDVRRASAYAELGGSAKR
jgi:hypothetical protein